MISKLAYFSQNAVTQFLSDADDVYYQSVIRIL